MIKFIVLLVICLFLAGTIGYKLGQISMINATTKYINDTNRVIKIVCKDLRVL